MATTKKKHRSIIVDIRQGLTKQSSTMNQETPFAQGFNLSYRVVPLGDHYAIEVTKDPNANGIGLIKDGTFLLHDGDLVRVSEVVVKSRTILYRRCLGDRPEDQYLDRLPISEFFGKRIDLILPAYAHRALVESKLGLGSGPMSVKVGAAAIVRAMQEDRRDAYARAMARLQPAPVGGEVFFVAEQSDRRFVDELTRHCFGIKSRASNFDCPAGADPQAWLQAQLRTARVIVVIVSSDLLFDDSLMTMLEDAAMNGKRLAPYIARACAWKECFLGKLQPLPSAGHEVPDAIRAALAQARR